jgi:hypothetical protein
MTKKLTDYLNPKADVVYIIANLDWWFAPYMMFLFGSIWGLAELRLIHIIPNLAEWSGLIH